MRIIVAILLLIIVGCNQSYAEDNISYAPAQVFFFPTDSPTYFFSDHFTGATYSQFFPDGHYIYIAKEHLGVSPFDEGTWSQSNDGTITLISSSLCADIICEPLQIQVSVHNLVDRLSELRQKIVEYLRSNVKNKYTEDDLKYLMVGKDYLMVEITDPSIESVTKSELQALLKAIDEFIKKPSLQNITLVPLSYKGKVFLTSLNQVRNRDYNKVCNVIDEGDNSKWMIFNDFMITEEEFNKGTEKPYPFKYFPEMNKLTGAE